MTISMTAWVAALGALLIVLPGLNLIGFVLLAFAGGSGAQRVLGPFENRKELY